MRKTFANLTSFLAGLSVGLAATGCSNKNTSQSVASPKPLYSNTVASTQPVVSPMPVQTNFSIVVSNSMCVLQRSIEASGFLSLSNGLGSQGGVGTSLVNHDKIVTYFVWVKVRLADPTNATLDFSNQSAANQENIFNALIKDR